MSFFKKVIGAIGNFAKSGVGSFGADLLTGGISSLAQGAIGSFFNRGNADYSNNLAQQNARFWAQYNSPINQMQRLKEAGLNPNLIYGNGTAVATADGNSGAPNVQGVNFDFRTPAQMALLKAQKATQVKQNDLLDSQILKTDADRALVQAQTTGQELQNIITSNADPVELGKYLNTSTKQHVELVRTEIEKNLSATQKTNVEYAVLDAERQLKLFDLDLKRVYGVPFKNAELLKSQSEAIIAYINSRYSNELNQLTLLEGHEKVNLLVAQIANFGALSLYYDQLTSNAKEEGKLIPKKGRKLDLDNEALGIANAIGRIKRDILKKTQGTATWSQNSKNIADGILSWIGLGSDAVDLYNKLDDDGSSSSKDEFTRVYEYDKHGRPTSSTTTNTRTTKKGKGRIKKVLKVNKMRGLAR